MRLVKPLGENVTTRNWKTPVENYAVSVRSVAAIMVTRIDGFQSLSEADPKTAELLLSKSYKLQQYYFELHGCTRTVKMGDTVIASFSSVDRAAACALKIQRGATKMFNHKLQIGIHRGEVRLVENDLFGTPLNVASDILEKAEPGQILVSESASSALNHDDFILEEQYSELGHLPIFEVRSKSIDQELFSDYAYRMVSGS